MSIFRSIIFLAIITIFVGCGGGGNSPSSFSVSGTVSGAVSSGVTMTLSGTSSGTTTTDANGNYTFGGIANGSYTITPSLSGYVFNSVSEAVMVNGVNITSINFTATASTNPTYNISGTVTLSSGEALSGVIVTLSGPGSGTATTDASGNFTFTGLINGSYTVTPSLSGHVFNSVSEAVTINGVNITSINFTTIPTPTYSISGTVTWNSGGVLEGVNMMLAVTYNTTTATDSSGNYIFTGLTNGNYTITPSLNGYRFNAASEGIKINGANVTSVNFIGVKE